MSARISFFDRVFMNESDSIAEIQRLCALSDGIFAVAMTLLTFNIHLPDSSAAGRLAPELFRMLGESVGLLLSFGIAAMFWMSHFRLFRFLRKADVGFMLLNFALLFSIVLLPICTSFETSFSRSPIAELVLGGNLALISLMNLFLWLYGLKMRFLALPAPGPRGALLELIPAIFAVLIFALSMLTMVWKPELGPRVWCLAFGTPLVSQFARRYLGLRAVKS
jgi:uncharacterized membrane protein